MKSHIVKFNKTGEYFKVDFYVTSIVKVGFTKDKKQATIFQPEADVVKADNGTLLIGNIKCREFSYFLCQNHITKDDVTLEYLDAPVQPLLNKE